jgi:hypothetical protein
MSSASLLRFYILLILSFVLSVPTFGQHAPQLRRHTVGMAGASIDLHTERKWHIQSTTGQGGVIGTTSDQGLTLRQGFIQPIREFSATKVSRELDVIIYPNPSTGIFNIQISSEQDAQIEVLDLSGRQLFNTLYKPGKNNMIDLEAFTSGVYLIKISAERQRYNGRIVKL